jgi:hypothetical protein
MRCPGTPAPIGCKGHPPGCTALASRSLPTQLPTQSRHRIRQRRSQSRSKGGSAVSMATCEHRQITPFPRFAHAVYLPTSLPADSATQQPTPKSFDVDDHEPIGRLHFRHGMRLQSKLPSENRFDEHLDPLPFGGCQNSPQEVRCIGDSVPPTTLETCCIQNTSLQLHSWDRSPWHPGRTLKSL